jgi:cyclophilin family peptidyl-prolyl cis-trans isomerase
MRLRLPPAAAILGGLLIGGCSIGGPTPTPTPACPTSPPTVDEAQAIVASAASAVVTTSQGEFTIQLEAGTAPIAVANFVNLSRCGFYDGVTFHRVISDFVAQAGDPQTRENREVFDGLGTGGPGYRFDVELPDASLTYRHYMVAMANAMQYDFNTGEITGGTDTNGSQFFVMLADVPTLRPYYSLLGAVSQGTNVVDAIGEAETSGDPYNTPLDPVVIEQIRIEGPGTG